MISTQENKISKNKIGLLNFTEEFGNISKSCKVMGFSRDTCYRYQEAYEEGRAGNCGDGKFEKSAKVNGLSCK